MADTPCVLIAQPVREGTPQVLIEMANEMIPTLTYPNFHRVAWPNSQDPTAEKYGTNAAARNQFIDKYLSEDYDYVLWLDIDIVDVPAGLIERLMLISELYEDAIVAPMVWDERKRFYDIGGFIKDGLWANEYLGVDGVENIEVMDSVGTCYLVPAWLYRNGLRYEPDGHDVEHLSFCEAARAEGVQVLAVRELRVTHAYLPNYGEAVHV